MNAKDWAREESRPIENCHCVCSQLSDIGTRGGIQIVAFSPLDRHWNIVVFIRDIDGIRSTVG